MSDMEADRECDAYWASRAELTCLLPVAQQRYGCCSANVTKTLYLPTPDMDKEPLEIAHRVWHIFCTILPLLFYFALARIVTQSWHRTAHHRSTLRFLIEFVIIVIPTIFSVNICNDWVELKAASLTVCLLLLLVFTKFWRKARDRREFEMGRRPTILTLTRGSINFLTVLCILAIDFESFPKEFRKSRRFGAGLMDVGIGLFCFSMGTVSHRPRKSTDFVRLLRTVTPVLLLGLARTVVIMVIDYHQDEHEYGLHLNAFFTLGLTKLFATLISATAISDKLLLPLGIGILALHETALQYGLSDYVMDKDIERDTFFAANREGLCSLPGFIGIYIISMYIGYWLQSKPKLNLTEFIYKLKELTLVCAITWLLTFIAIFSVGIARVTCNSGYSIWILNIAITMTLAFLISFDLILNTLWPIENTPHIGAGDEAALLVKPSLETTPKKFLIPTLLEAINLNGLTFFLIANVLTGGVNIFLSPENRSDAESVLILTLYLLIAIGFVYIMQRLRIRIA